MTIDELRDRKRELLDEKKRLTEAGADPLEIQLIAEELIDVNANLRRMTPGHRVGGKKVTADGGSSDRQQYLDWAGKTWGELEAAGVTWEEMESGTDRLKRIVAETDLTEVERKYFDLWATGRNGYEIAEICGVHPSTIGRGLERAKKKMRAAAEYLKAADPEYDGKGIRIDAADPEAAKLLLSICTPLQIVYLYLYYGEWLSCAEIGKLLQVDKTAALRGITRGLAGIGKLFPKQEILLDNMDALGDAAYALYCEREWTDAELTPEKPAPGWDWGRRVLGISHIKPPSMTYKDRPEIDVRTSFGVSQAVRERREETTGLPRGKLLTALLERLRSSSAEQNALRRWLLALFGKVKTKLKEVRKHG